MSKNKILWGSRIFDGFEFYDGKGLAISNGLVEGVIEKVEGDNYYQYENICLDGGLLAPGFIDLQVNGGGGVLFNNQTDENAIFDICRAHLKLGVTSVMVTLITDRKSVIDKAIAASIKANENKIAGYLGLHLEGPFLSHAKPGVHDTKYIKNIDDDEVAELISAKGKIENMLMTFGVENVTCQQASLLNEAGIILSIGHSNAKYEQAMQYFNSGANMVTHLYNAMSPLNHREAGLVGATLINKRVFTSIIADGYHVDIPAIEIALRSKGVKTKIEIENNQIGKLFLVSDAMATVGSSEKSFSLYDHKIILKNDMLQLEDGTLAGAHLDLAMALRFLVREVKVDLAEALRMASLYPAQAIRQDNLLGQFKKGSIANIIRLDANLQVSDVWLGGNKT